MHESIGAEVHTLMRNTLSELKKRTQSFSPRSGQNRMFSEVARTLSGAYEQPDYKIRSIVIEGQTGSGKTLGYAIPAISYAQVYNERHRDKEKLTVVIATANVGLQQQILNTDLPKLAATNTLGTIKPELVVGRRRYLCVRDAMVAASNATGHESSHSSKRESIANQSESLLDAFESGAWSGMKDDLSLSISETTWSLISANADTCSNRKCPHYDDCPFVNARKRISEANVIVTNHNMIYSNLNLLKANPELALLPDPKNTILVMDEAHHVPSSFRDSGVLSFSAKQLSDVVKSKNQVKKGINVLARRARIPAVSIDEDILSLNSTTKRFIDNSVDLINSTSEPRSPDSSRFTQGKVDPAFLNLLTHELKPLLTRISLKLEKFLTDIGSGILSDMKNDSATSQYVLSIKQAISVCDNAANTVYGYENTRGPGYAKWLSRLPRSRNVSLHFTPLKVASDLYEEIVKQHYATVFTSATLRSLSKFSYYIGEMGFQPNDGVNYMLVESPFDYSRSTLHVDKSIVSPQNEQEHTEEILKRLPKDFQGHRSGLMLFSSKRQMSRFVDGANQKLKGIMHIQYTAPREELIRRHKKDVDAGRPSFLIGVQSFSEGMDLPGKYLTFVGIAKIPFADISSPVDAALSEAIQLSGKGSPFTLQLLPAASKRLIQSVGRLMRSNNCYGDCHIYDSRLLTKGYGKSLLDSLPPMRRSF